MLEKNRVFPYYSVQGLIKIQAFMILFMFWGSLFFAPPIHFLLGNLFDIRLTLLNWQIIALIFSMLVYIFVLNRIILRNDEITIFFENKIILMHFTGTTLIIPQKALQKVFVDKENLLLGIRYKLQILGPIALKPLLITKPNTLDEINTLITKFLDFDSTIIKEKRLKSIKFSLGTKLYPIKKENTLESFSQILPSVVINGVKGEYPKIKNRFNFVLLVTYLVGYPLIFIFLLAFLLENIFDSLILTIFPDLYQTISETSLYFGIIYDILTILFIGALIWYFLRNTKEKDLPLSKKLVSYQDRQVSIRYLVLLSLALVFVAIGTYLSFYYLYSLIFNGSLPSTLQNFSYTSLTPYYQSLSIIAIGIVGPITEELLYRGYLLRATIREQWNWKYIYLIQIITFSVIHWNGYIDKEQISVLTHFTFTIIFAILSTWVVRKTGTIWSSILIHIGYNSFFNIAEVLYSLELVELSKLFVQIISILGIVTVIISIAIILIKSSKSYNLVKKGRLRIGTVKQFGIVLVFSLIFLSFEFIQWLIIYQKKFYYDIGMVFYLIPFLGLLFYIIITRQRKERIAK